MKKMFREKKMRLEEVIDFPKEVLKNRNTQFVLCLISHSFFFLFLTSLRGILRLKKEKNL